MKKVLSFLMTLVVICSCGKSESTRQGIINYVCDKVNVEEITRKSYYSDNNDFVGIKKSSFEFVNIKNGDSSALFELECDLIANELTSRLGSPIVNTIEQSSNPNLRSDNTAYAHYYKWSHEGFTYLFSYDHSDDSGMSCEMSLYIKKN